MEKWQAVCSACHKHGPAVIREDESGRPNYAPKPIGGKCDRTSDGKHAPRWERAK